MSVAQIVACLRFYLKQGWQYIPYMQNNLQIVTRDPRSLFLFNKGKAQKDWQVFSSL